MRFGRRDPWAIDLTRLVGRDREALRRCWGHKPRRRRPQSWWHNAWTNLTRLFAAPEPVPVRVDAGRWR